MDVSDDVQSTIHYRCIMYQHTYWIHDAAKRFFVRVQSFFSIQFEQIFKSLHQSLPPHMYLSDDFAIYFVENSKSQANFQVTQLQTCICIAIALDQVSILLSPFTMLWNLTDYFPFLFLKILFLGRGEGKQKGRETSMCKRNTDWLPFTRPNQESGPQLGTKPIPFQFEGQRSTN